MLPWPTRRSRSSGRRIRSIVKASPPNKPVYTKQVFGSYQVVGTLVRFFPRLPTHLRDPETQAFYPFASPQDSAEAAIFLASPEARYITGVNLNVNAGNIM